MKKLFCHSVIIVRSGFEQCHFMIKLSYSPPAADPDFYVSSRKCYQCGKNSTEVIGYDLARSVQLKSQRFLVKKHFKIDLIVCFLENKRKKQMCLEIQQKYSSKPLSGQAGRCV